MQKQDAAKGQILPAYFPVSDFYLAAFLICSGFELAHTSRVGPSRVLFFLRDGTERPQAVNEFYGHKSRVDPLAFKDAIVNLKSLIHAQKAQER